MRNFLLSLLTAVVYAQDSDDCKVQKNSNATERTVEVIPLSEAVDQTQANTPSMTVSWYTQKCGAGDQERHEMVMGAEVASSKADIEDGYIMMWFTFQDVPSANKSTMTCTVEYKKDVETNSAADGEVHISEYYGATDFATQNTDWRTMFESERKEIPLWVFMGEGDPTADDWIAGYKRTGTTVSKAKCFAKRLIGRFPDLVLDERNNEDLIWKDSTVDNSQTFIDLVSETEYTFTAGYKIYTSEGEIPVESQFASDESAFKVKWKDAMSLAASSAAAIAILAALI